MKAKKLYPVIVKKCINKILKFLINANFFFPSLNFALNLRSFYKNKNQFESNVGLIFLNSTAISSVHCI